MSGVGKEEKVCPECAATVKAIDKRCLSCGFRFDQVPPAGSPLTPPRWPPPEIAKPSEDPQGENLATRSIRTVANNWKDFWHAAAPESGCLFRNRITLGVLGALLVGLLITFAVLSRDEARRVSVTSGSLRPAFTLGGQSSRTVPTAVAIESLKRKKSQGYKLVAIALRREIVTQFREIPPDPKWKSEFLLNGGPKRLLFRAGGMSIGAYSLNRRQSDAISRLGLNLYGFEALAGYDALGDRLRQLLDQISSTTLYEGESSSEISSAGYELAEDLRAWLKKNREFLLPETRLVVDSDIALADAAGRLGAEINQSNLDSYNAAISTSNFASEQRANSND